MKRDKHVYSRENLFRHTLCYPRNRVRLVTRAWPNPNNLRKHAQNRDTSTFLQLP